METTFNKNIVTVFTLKLTVCGLLMILLTMQSCKKDNPKLETDRVREILTDRTWNIQTVTIGSTDKTTAYDGMTLSFTNTSYFAVNGGLVWPNTGTWAFADKTGKLITRGDGLAITVEEATAVKLVLKLTWAKTTLGSGRTSSLAGEHVFTFSK